MKILVLNCGSSSVKYQVIETTTQEKIVDDDIQRVTDHATAIREILNKVDLSEIKAIGHRVVHGGENFTQSVVVNDEVLAEMDRIEFLAPLHNPAAMAGVRACRELMPDLPNVLIFDTAFHSTMEPGAYLYGLPMEDYEKYGIRKYGFHGTSHQYVAEHSTHQYCH